MDVSFETITNVIFFVGAAQGIILSVFLFNVKNNILSNRLLGTLTLLWAVVFIVFALQNYGLYRYFPHLLMTFFHLLLAWFPLLYLSVKYLLESHKKFNRRDLLHFLPMLFNIFLYSGFYVRSAEQKIEIVNTNEGFFHIATVISEEMLSIQGIVYTVISLILIQQYKKNIINFQSNINERVLTGYRTGIVLALIAWIIGIVGTHLERFDISPGIDLFMLVYLTFVIIIYVLSILAIKSPEVFKLSDKALKPFTDNKVSPKPVGRKTTQVKKPRGSTVLDEIDDHNVRLNNRLLSYMAADKPYLNPDLSLQEMAEQLEVTRHQLSAVINQMQGMNFYEFINKYRVQEVKDLMNDPKNISRRNYDLAFDAGFNSRASFYRIFRQYTGQTPSEYRLELELSEVNR
jgi:AraC-like DNA-binding protein